MIKQPKKCILAFFMLNVSLYPMGLQKYLERPEEYENFRLTRPYGMQLKSNFDSIPKEVFKGLIESYIRVVVATKYKHILLQHKQTMQSFRNVKEQDKCVITPLEDVEKYRKFIHYDGKYNVVPDVKNEYLSWDTCDDQKFKWGVTDHHGHDIELIALLNNPNSILKTCLICPEKEYENKKQHTFYIERYDTEEFLEQLFKDEITSYVLSNDGAWILFGAKNNVQIFDVNAMKYQKPFYCGGDVKAICAAHNAPFFAVCIDEELMLINSQSTIHSRDFEASRAKCIEFSPTDKYLSIMSSRKIQVVRVSDWRVLGKFKSESRIKKNFFVSDDSMVIALANGELCVWSDFSKNPLKKTKYNSFWQKSSIIYNNRKPLIVWNRKDNLLFTVDPFYDPTFDNFRVHVLDTGRLLFSLTMVFNLPIAVGMGLLNDERTIVFLEDDDMVRQLQLYGDQDNADIDFIEHEADWYQLCCLWEIFNVLEHSLPIVSDVRAMIESYRKKQ